jgi:hypothetical protein
MMISFLLFRDVLDERVLRDFKNSEFDYNVRIKLYSSELTKGKLVCEMQCTSPAPNIGSMKCKNRLTMLI